MHRQCAITISEINLGIKRLSRELGSEPVLVGKEIYILQERSKFLMQEEMVLTSTITDYPRLTYSSSLYS